MSAMASPPQAVALPADAHPLRFVQNNKQWEKPVLFAADIPGGRLFLEKNRLLVARYDAQAADEHHHHPSTKTQRIQAHAYAVNFVGANPQTTAVGEARTEEITNYFLGNDPARWATNVPAYQDVRYRALYPGTDLRFYGRGHTMEYDFELAAGADPARIGLRYTGQQALRVAENGALQIETSVGRVTEQRPVAYQLTADGRRQNVPCRYVLAAGNVMHFGLGAFDHARPLVIDPVLVYSTYTGSSANTWGYTAAHDTLGNLYAGSIVFGTGYPATVGAYDLNFNGGSGSSIAPGSLGPTDILLVKYNPAAANGAGSRVSATYLGGSGNDFPHSLVVDGNGDVVLLGSTSSTNFPTSATGRYRANAGSTDLVVVKLSSTLGLPYAGTYLGGSGADGQLSVAATNELYQNFGDDYRGDVITDAQNNIYLTSVSRSTNFPSTGGFQTSNRGGHEAVVSKLNPTLSTLLWSSYLGGTADDAGYSIQLDAQNGVYVAGGTRSTNFPGTANGLNPTYQGGTVDGFVARIAPAGNALVQATYLGTSSYDQAHFVQLDNQGKVYVLGQTNGAYPLLGNTYRGPAGSRQFIHKLEPDLQTSLFSTVIGNGPGAPTAANPYPTNLSPTAFLVDNCGQIFLSGWGASSIAGMPTTPDALQRTAANSTPTSGTTPNANSFGYAYVMQLSANARRLLYGTYYGNGATHVDGGTSRFDKKGTIYQTVCIRGSNAGPLPFSANAYARSYGGGGSSAAFKIDAIGLRADFDAAAGAPDRTGCAPLTVTFVRPSASGNGTTWNFGNGQTSTTANNVTTTYTTPGTYSARLTAYDSTGCQRPVSTTQTITVLGLPKPTAGPDQAVCPGSAATLRVSNATPVQNATYTWSPATGLNTTAGPAVVATPAFTTQYVVTASVLNNSCPAQTDTVLVTVSRPLPLPISYHPALPLVAQPVTFADSTGGTPISGLRTWDFGDGQTATGPAPVHSYTAPGTYTVVLANTLPGLEACPARSTRAVVVAGETPNVITPNGDGQNDTFRPAVAPGTATLAVFNRWGRKVFEQANYAPTPSTGFGDDPALAPGVYFYRLLPASGPARNGWLEVLR